VRPRLQILLEVALAEADRSITVHGEWKDYTPELVHKAVSGEFREYESALMSGDMHSAHGQRVELLQLMVVAAKGYIRLGVSG